MHDMTGFYFHPPPSPWKSSNPNPQLEQRHIRHQIQNTRPAALPPPGPLAPSVAAAVASAVSSGFRLKLTAVHIFSTDRSSPTACSASIPMVHHGVLLLRGMRRTELSAPIADRIDGPLTGASSELRRRPYQEETRPSSESLPWRILHLSGLHGSLLRNGIQSPHCTSARSSLRCRGCVQGRAAPASSTDRCARNGCQGRGLMWTPTTELHQRGAEVRRGSLQTEEAQTAAARLRQSRNESRRCSQCLRRRRAGR